MLILRAVYSHARPIFHIECKRQQSDNAFGDACIRSEFDHGATALRMVNLPRIPESPTFYIYRCLKTKPIIYLDGLALHQG